MARGRMLNRKISMDEKVHKLPNDTARLLFTWIIPQLDINGCFYGDPVLVKNTIFPRRDDISVKDIESYIDHMAKLSLVIKYSTNGDVYLHFPGFVKNQNKLNPDREGESDIPPYSRVTQELLNGNSTQDKISKDNINIREDNIIGGNSKRYPPQFIDFRKQVFAGLKERRGYTSKQPAAEAGAINKMLIDGHAPDNILKAYDFLKAQPFWQDKNLSLMKVNVEINEVLKNGKNQRSGTKDYSLDKFRAKHG